MKTIEITKIKDYNGLRENLTLAIDSNANAELSIAEQAIITHICSCVSHIKTLLYIATECCLLSCRTQQSSIIALMGKLIAEEIGS